MPKPKQCGATTQKGRRCRNLGNPQTSGLCALHAKSQRLRDTAAVALNQTRPEKAITVTTTVEVLGGTIVDIPSAIIQVIEIVEFVGRNWPQIPHLARHRVLRPKPNAAANLIKDCERMIKSGEQDANLASRFERWFESLPTTVKVEAEIEFGDIRSTIRLLRDSSA
jgi:hypothetical protein